MAKTLDEKAAVLREIITSAYEEARDNKAIFRPRSDGLGVKSWAEPPSLNLLVPPHS